MSDRFSSYTDEELLAYLEERLASDVSREIEEELRTSPELKSRLGVILATQEDASVAIGAVWSRARLSCPDRAQWSSYVLKLMEDQAYADYLQFHLETIGCRYCQAQVEDLSSALLPDPQKQARQKKHFESSIGTLRKSEY